MLNKVYGEFAGQRSRKGISAWDHPQYSPDLVPTDLWLFTELKKKEFLGR
jgi:hypothetical protein